LSIHSSESSFAALGLSEQALRALQAAHYVQPTPIQARAIPPALAGHDVIGCAATGTGKTAAFTLPIIERLAGKPGTRALVLAPTRELANQIAEYSARFGAVRGVRCVPLIGGVGMRDQVSALRSGAQIVIATPGRLIDHLKQGTARLDSVEILVLDEADRMLDMGFKRQLERILERVPAQRQTLLFSATTAGEVAEFARIHLRGNAVRVDVARSRVTAERAEQHVFCISQGEKTALLLALLSHDEASTLVFTRTKHRADKLARSVERAGHKVARIHANRTQSQREQALDGFRDGRYRVLVATNIAARGIDVAEIGHVVNFDLPNVPADYVHRVGRTARAAARGVASSFVSPEETPLLRDIEKFTRLSLPRAEVPRTSPVFRAELTRDAERHVEGNARQPGFGVSVRPAGQPRGRHARTHRKPLEPRRHAQASASVTRSGGDGERPARLVFSGSPRRRK
jgi:ATP-dependent RNA helicase RhlE